MGGAKVWDVEVGDGHSPREVIANVVWSPNGLQIAVVHHPPRISFHSCHDGSEIRSVYMVLPSDRKLEGVWWIDHGGDRVEPDGLMNMLRRDGNAPGSAHSVLQMLPLLDALSSDSQSGSATLYNIKKGHNTPDQSHKSILPHELESFPSLPPNPIAASIAKGNSTTGRSLEKASPSTDKPDRSLEDTLVVATDDHGSLFLLLEGSYVLGRVDMPMSCSLTSVHKPTPAPVLFVHGWSGDHHRTDLVPWSIQLSLLQSSSLRHVAKASTTVCALLTYLTKVLEEMRRAWFGTPSLEGGRETGRKWIRVLEEKEEMFEGATKTNPIFELTNLLFTGKTSGAMREFLGGSGKLSERGMAQWEATVQGALSVLQESAERRLSPACERLIIVLEEVRGWSAWTQRYSPFLFDTVEVDECLAMCHRAIELSEWLSQAAEIEAGRFHEFMRWMKAETSRVTDGVVGDLRAPTYDPLEVSEYLECGLLDSPLDKWFLGPVPQSNPSQVKPLRSRTMGEVLADVRKVIEDVSQPYDPSSDSNKPPGNVHKSEDHFTPLSDLDRNLVDLINELSSKCWSVFWRASGATGREAVVDSAAPANYGDAQTTEPKYAREMLIRDRLVVSTLGAEVACAEYFAIALSRSQDRGDSTAFLAVFNLEYGNRNMDGMPSRISCAMFTCRAEAGDDGQTFDLVVLDLAFFDDDTLLLVTRTLEADSGDTADGRSFLMSVPYGEADYTELSIEWTASREKLMQQVTQMCEDGTGDDEDEEADEDAQIEKGGDAVMEADGMED
ncbi:hypothetical protein FRB99_000546 [Tulasnella sp. 403]|nr:hypothetical protein FRB99_000546 [Tulasnella sp. 403]